MKAMADRAIPSMWFNMMAVRWKQELLSSPDKCASGRIDYAICLILPCCEPLGRLESSEMASAIG